MKWIAALLMIVNVAVYLWASGGQVSVDEIARGSKPDVNKAAMLLLQETDSQNPDFAIVTPGLDESGPDSAQSVESPPASQLVQVEVAVAAPDENPEQPELLQKTIPACYRVGPFKQQQSWLSAREWMTRNNAEFQQVTSQSRELRAVRIFLGPYDSISAAAPVMQELKEKNLEHFPYLLENGLARISLGYFTQEPLAAKFLDHLQAIGVAARSLSEYQLLGPFNWMEIPVENIEQSILAAHDWQEPAVRLSRIECRGKPALLHMKINT